MKPKIIKVQTLKKIISSSQTKEVDQHTIKNEPILSLDLMERASKAFVSAIENLLHPNESIAVVCGTGNNGGDGLAIARILMWKGFDVQPFLFLVNDQLSPDCAANKNKLDNVISIDKQSALPPLDDFDVIIDGLFGSGLNRGISGLLGKVVDVINNAKAVKYSIDIPSGLYCDALPDGGHIVKSDLTVSFQRPKLSFFLSETSDYVGAWQVVDIGLDENYIQSQNSDVYLLDQDISTHIKNRKKYSHKGSYGHALIISGARGKMGAAVLCGGACLRSGVGLLTMHIPNCGVDIIQTSIPEAMCSIDTHAHHLSILPDLSKYSSIGIGPGVGQSKETKEALIHLLRTTSIPLVLDADALNILSEDQSCLALIPEGSVLTPHPKEFERLVGVWNDSLERLEKQKAFARIHQCIVVLKDADTIIVDAMGNVYINTTGNAGMATGGSGDVLTGIITGLVAQKYSTLEAALIGVYYHGLAGDQAAAVKGMNALIASDIIEHLKIEID